MTPSHSRPLFGLCLFTILLSACLPGGGVRGDPVFVTIDGSRFEIRRAGNMAIATRRNFEWLPDAAAVSRKAARAVEDATGCAPAWVTGDPSVMRFGLDCPGGAGPPPRPRRALAL